MQAARIEIPRGLHFQCLYRRVRWAEADLCALPVKLEQLYYEMRAVSREKIQKNGAM